MAAAITGPSWSYVLIVPEFSFSGIFLTLNGFDFIYTFQGCQPRNKKAEARVVDAVSEVLNIMHEKIEARKQSTEEGISKIRYGYTLYCAPLIINISKLPQIPSRIFPTRFLLALKL